MLNQALKLTFPSDIRTGYINYPQENSKINFVTIECLRNFTIISKNNNSSNTRIGYIKSQPNLVVIQYLRNFTIIFSHQNINFLLDFTTDSLIYPVRNESHPYVSSVWKCIHQISTSLGTPPLHQELHPYVQLQSFWWIFSQSSPLLTITCSSHYCCFLRLKFAEPNTSG